MDLPLFLLALFGPVISSVLPPDSYQTFQLLSSCRVHCLSKFLPQIQLLADSSCRTEPNCRQCWDDCAFFQDDLARATICSKAGLCFEGCRVACSVYQEGINIRGKKQEIWAFSRHLRTDRE